MIGDEAVAKLLASTNYYMSRFANRCQRSAPVADLTVRKAHLTRGGSYSGGRIVIP